MLSTKLIILAIIVLLVSVRYGIFRLQFKSQRPVEFGASFSPSYAQFLGLDPRAVFEQLLTDIPFKYLRLSAQWDEIQPEPTSSTFSELDWYLAEAHKRGVLVVIAVGQKTPRWPECHIPVWAKKLSPPAYKQAFRDYITAVVTHYREHPALEYWQVENEPHLTFGDCASFDSTLVPEAFGLVKQLDPYHARIATDSGELSTWRQTAHAGDLFGTTLYRTVWNRYLKYITYDQLIPAALYRFKAFVQHISPEAAMIIELQAEPWIPNGSAPTTPVAEQLRSMNPTRLASNLEFATRIGFSRVYVWGVEWWYYLGVKHADRQMIEAAQAVLRR